MNNKKDIFLSLLCGFIAGLFLIIIIKNPIVDEFKDLLKTIGVLIWFLPFVLSILFLFGILVAKNIFKSIKFLFQFAKFAESGILNTLIDIGILNALMWSTGIVSGTLIIPLNAISFSCAVVNSYFWNKFWTFEKKDKAKGKEFLQFFIVTMVGLGINTAIVYLGTTFILPIADLSGGAWANIIKIAATLISMIWNFSAYKFIVFKK